MAKSRIGLIIVFSCISSILFSQEKMDFNYILIENLPKASQILTLKMDCFYPSASIRNECSITGLTEPEFLILLDKAKSIQPESKLLRDWHYSPWYWIEFTTTSGRYELQLFLGGLGTMTLPNGKKGAIMLDLDLINVSSI